VNRYTYIVVGSGIAGLYTALFAKEQGSVLIMTKGSIDDCNTRHAQGGIAAAIGSDDSLELHWHDTVAAGDQLCDEEAVRILVSEARARISELVHFGVPFDTLDGRIALTTEAAHSVARILHAGGDATGEHIETTLSKQVRAANISVLENFMATEILVSDGQVSGIKGVDCRTGFLEEFTCDYLILATGGAGQLYKFNTNSDVATGDGVALAFNAGAEIVDLEFFQFHPTALRLPGVPPFLITEAIRGEGGVLLNESGYRFMPDYTRDGDLAPRDVVTRSIIYEMEKTGSDRCFIDITHLPRHVITTRFPSIYRFCKEHGLDITRELIPVAPAAHYMMGGVKVNTWGETNIKGLFATGETACTSVHGANRLASNSLLEAIVFSNRIIQITQSKGREAPFAVEGKEKRCFLKQWQPAQNVPLPSLSRLQQLLWDKVGIIRTEKELTEAANLLAGWQKSLPLSTDRPSLELSNLVLVGRLVTEAALVRQESRGAHFRSDFPHSSPDWQCHIVFTRG